MEAGTIVRWLKSEGEPVEKGEPLYELDTDKVTQEVEAEASGVLLRIAVAQGEVPVGETIAFIGAEGEEVAVEARKPAEAPKPEPAQAAVPDEPPRQEQPIASATTNGRVKASPLARRIARERGIDLATVRGTGPDGRVVAEDVERAATVPAPAAPISAPVAPAPAGEVERRPLTNIRKTIARRLTQAWTVPAFQLTIRIEMTRANELLARHR
jgi:pyruvate dehydrogenase E2 component (dihydrolipoamide acetyltransferase)